MAEQHQQVRTPRSTTTNASMSTLSVNSDDSGMSYAIEDLNRGQIDFSIPDLSDIPCADTDGDTSQMSVTQESQVQEGDDNSTTGGNDDGHSWIFIHKYGERYTTREGKECIRCKVTNCSKTYSSVKKTTTTFIAHLVSAHGISENNGPHTQNNKRIGPLDSFLSKRTRTFDQNEFHKQFIKFLVSSKLPFTTSESKDLQQLLEMAQMAPTLTAVKLPSANTFTRKVCRCWNILCMRYRYNKSTGLLTGWILSRPLKNITYTMTRL